MKPTRIGRLAAALVLCASLFAGCALQRIHDDTDRFMREGRYEQAVRTLEAGLVSYPGDGPLRSALLQTRNEAMIRLTSEAARERAIGRFDDAEALLRRAEAFDTGGKRASALLAEITTERRQREALARANELAATQPHAALRIVAEALKDNPRQPELVALQRKLLSESRRSQLRGSQLGLAEKRPISLDFRDTGLRTVLDTITRNSGVNFIFDKDLRQDVRVTVYLRSAVLEDAIDLIVSTHQLAKKVLDDRTILLYPNTPEKQREYQELVVRVFHLANADAKGAGAFLRSMLRLREPFVDERSNMIAIREPIETVELAERLMALYDTNDAEVLLELEVLEVRSSRLTDLGIQFPDTIALTPLSLTGTGAGLTLGNLRGLGADRVGVSVAGLLLNLKREVGDFNTLANPRIRVRNKEKAKVLIGDKVPVVTATTTQTGFVADSVSYLDVGLKLEVEPTVFVDDEVAVRVNMEVSSLGREVRTTSGSLAYQIGTRMASTVLRLRDGETQLLAGLISRDERSSSSRLPGLGDLPIAGRLFSSQRDELQRTELVLAITPRILRNLRRPDAAEAELWIGTEAMPRARAAGGFVAQGRTVDTSGRAPVPSPSVAVPSVRPVAGAPMLGGEGVPAGSSGAQLSVQSGPLREDPTDARVAAFWSAPSQVRVGDVFSADLVIESTAPIRGAPLSLKFSSDVLQVLEVEEGDFLRSDGVATSFTKSIDAGGAVRAGVLRNHAGGVTGVGRLLTLKLRAVSAGAAELTIQSLDAVTGGPVGATVKLPAVQQIIVQ